MLLLSFQLTTSSTTNTGHQVSTSTLGLRHQFTSPRLPLLIPLFRSQQINLTLGTVITPDKQAPISRIPAGRSQPEAITLSEPISRAAPGIRRPKNVLVPILTIGRRNRIIAPIRQLRERDLDDLEPRGGLAIPRSVEGDVHVLGVFVKGVPNWCAVGHEGETRGDGFAVARGVVEGRVGREDELGAGFQAGGGGEGGGVPDCEAGWVAVPGVASFEGITDCRYRVSGDSN